MLLGKAAFVCFLFKKKRKEKKCKYFLSNIGSDALAVFTGSTVKWSYNITHNIQSNGDHVPIKLKSFRFKSSVVTYYYLINCGSASRN